MKRWRQRLVPIQPLIATFSVLQFFAASEVGDHCSFSCPLLKAVCDPQSTRLCMKGQIWNFGFTVAKKGLFLIFCRYIKGSSFLAGGEREYSFL